MGATYEGQVSIKSIEELIWDVPDFPKPGVTFKDITPLLENPQAFKSVAQQMVDIIQPLVKEGRHKLVAIESRGFIFACAIAPLLNMGVVLARKPGKLPRPTVSHTYELEYGTDTLEIHEGSLDSEDRVFIIDDVLATGGTAQAVETLCLKMGADVVSSLFLMELGFLNGIRKLSRPAQALIRY